MKEITEAGFSGIEEVLDAAIKWRRLMANMEADIERMKGKTSKGVPRPRPSKPVMPKGLPPLPKGYVYLGKGRTFQVGPEGFRGSHFMEGSRWFPGWGAVGTVLGGDGTDCHYAAPKDSDIAKLNGL